MISIISPVYNESSVLPEFIRRLSKVLEANGESYQIILVNDGSSDDSLALMKKFHEENSNIKIISLSRNFGHQIAICAGLDYAEGDLITIMDSDLQDPPEVLPQFFDKLREGYDVVYAIRRNRKENCIKRFFYAVFYMLLRKISSVDIPRDSGDFCVISRKAKDTLNMMPERNRFVRGLRGWIGFKQIGLEYDRDKRFSGNVKYTLNKLLQLAFDGFTSFSHFPLRIASVLGMVVSLFSFIGISYIFYLSFFTSKTVSVPGWASIVVAILALGGIQLITIGIIGEYIGRIYDEVKHRPLYVVQETVGLEDKL